MNSVQKGARAENERIKYLESLGYKVLPRPARSKFRKKTDYFGYWDIVCYKPEGIFTGYWLVEQVKCNSKDKLKKYKKAAIYLPKYTIAHFIIRHDRKKLSERWEVIDLR